MAQKPELTKEERRAVAQQTAAKDLSVQAIIGATTLSVLATITLSIYRPGTLPEWTMWPAVAVIMAFVVWMLPNMVLVFYPEA